MRTFNSMHTRALAVVGGLVLAGALVVVSWPERSARGQAQKGKLLGIAQDRGLSGEDLVSAVSTYPRGEDEDFLCLNSGGQAGSVIAYAVPSMRVLKYIPTTAPDSASGFRYDEQSLSVADQGNIEGQRISWGDTHHPGFSEIDGAYDGEFAFINDKANPRIFVIDLRDLETKQIVPNPLFRSDHGGAFVTPNTRYVIEASQYPTTLDHAYVPMTQGNFNGKLRGGITFHRFDREKGRIDRGRSFTIIAPPYVQDLSDAGKGESAGYSFTNSLCTERYIGGIEKGRPPFEAGCSSRDTDLMHVINWKKAEELIAGGKGRVMNGHQVLPMELAAREGVLTLIPEPKSPHGVDVSPDGRFVIVAGKLDTHVTVFDFRKIKSLIENKEFAERDPYGIPVLDMNKAMHGQIQLGLGPLHTQFDKRENIAYTSLYIDSQIVRYDYKNLEILDKESVHYNIGHLVSMQGDSVDPRGGYVIALNKLAIDRFSPVGPLHPQNHQLVDISGDTMRLVYDLPLPMGEPHYTACIATETIQPLEAYEVGTDPTTMARSDLATEAGQEKAEREGSTVTVNGTLSRAGIAPKHVEAVQGDQVIMHLTNLETDGNGTIEVTVGGMGALSVFPPGKMATLKFTASQAGHFPVAVAAVDDGFPTDGYGLLSVRPKDSFESERAKETLLASADREKLRSWDFGRDIEDEALAPGEAEFTKYGCAGCHQRGRELGGPDLTNVTVRRSKGWLVEWIENPPAFYDTPYVEAMIERYGIKMPKQGVSKSEAERIVEYLDTWSTTAAATAESDASETAEQVDRTGEPEGQRVYRRVCFACHDNGVGGAPVLGNKELWAPRAKKGWDALMTSVEEGYRGKVGYMPARGGCGDCTDEELEAALRYILEQGR
ncbi:MAG: Sec-dependent nitrous-oxide reductase [Myxococcota bacterium]